MTHTALPTRPAPHENPLTSPSSQGVLQALVTSHQLTLQDHTQAAGPPHPEVPSISSPVFVPDSLQEQSKASP